MYHFCVINKVYPKISTSMKTVIYARVSTEEQKSGRQVEDLTGLCTALDWKVAKVFTESISGTKKYKERTELQKLIAYVEKHEIKKVVMSEVSRLSRSIHEGIGMIELFTRKGVSIYFQNIALETLRPDGTENFMFKPILATLLGFSEMENKLRLERQLSGIAVAKNEGVYEGRKKGSIESDDKFLSKHKAVVKLLNKGDVPIRMIASSCECSTATVQKVKKLLLAT